ncbi:MAG: L-ascorbate metabolism protein UlaG (beta-lactamase superfamily) [Shewanella psychromarinicola]|jgi:L-ascorbate metabolism protein UlaG (beta-lactamase superfamily)|uniref:MBL fold metallo-hydrolase n=1 Tax=Shewanella psychromarinicola TaxID=2487742 RepID=UPI003EEED126
MWQSLPVEGIKFTSEPSVHDSALSTSDHNKTLWASWVIGDIYQRILFIGDTGYSGTIFNHLDDKYSSFDYAILLIGAYELRALM